LQTTSDELIVVTCAIACDEDRKEAFQLTSMQLIGVQLAGPGPLRNSGKLDRALFQENRYGAANPIKIRRSSPFQAGRKYGGKENFHDILLSC
jgi:hypothetical protein